MNRDEELDAILARLQSPSPTTMQTQKWKANRPQKEARGFSWASVAASLFVGILIGLVMGVLFHREAPTEITNQSLDGSTYVYVGPGEESQ